MNKFLCLLSCILLSSNSLPAQKLYVTGLILNSTGDSVLKGDFIFRVYVDGATNYTKIRSNWQGTDYLLITSLNQKVSSVRIEIIKQGYKTSSINLPFGNWDGNDQYKNIGTIRLNAEITPVNINIISGIEGQKNVTFEINCFNKTNQPIIVDSMFVELSSIFDKYERCFDPTPDIDTYIINDSIYIERVNNQTSKVTGKYVAHNKFQIQVHGNIGYNKCGRYQYLRLTVPCSFSLTSKQLNKLIVTIPASLKAIDANSSKINRVNVSNEFKDIKFVLVPSPEYNRNIEISAVSNFDNLPKTAIRKENY